MSFTGPALNQVIVGKVNKAKNNPSVGGALSFMNMSKAQLKANYSITNLGEEQITGGMRRGILQLTPNTPTSYKSAEIWVDSDGMPRQAKVNEQNSDSTTVLLSNIQKNITLKAEIFQVEISWKWSKRSKRSWIEMRLKPFAVFKRPGLFR